MQVAPPTAGDRVHRPDRQGSARLDGPPPSQPAPTYGHALGRALQPHRLRGAAAARPGGAAKADLREFIPGPSSSRCCWCFVFAYVFPKIGRAWWRGRRRAVLDDADRRRAGLGHHVPGHPGRGAADGAGVRLHEGDRGPGAAPLPVALVALEKVIFGPSNALGSGPGVPDRRRRARKPHPHQPAGALAGADHAAAAGLRDHYFNNPRGINLLR